MPSSIPVGPLRKVYTKAGWMVPEPFGDGWRIVRKDRRASVIVTAGRFDGEEWIHASIARSDRMPDYADLVALHAAVWGTWGHSFQAFVPPTEHVNIHPNALHLWGRADGTRTWPDFGRHGTI